MNSVVISTGPSSLKDGRYRQKNRGEGEDNRIGDTDYLSILPYHTYYISVLYCFNFEQARTIHRSMLCQLCPIITTPHFLSLELSMWDRECISMWDTLSPCPSSRKSWHHDYHMTYSGSIKTVLGANVFIVKTLASGQVLEPMILKQVVQPTFWWLSLWASGRQT